MTNASLYFNFHCPEIRFIMKLGVTFFHCYWQKTSVCFLVFQIALVLFESNSSDILGCDGFESIIEFMKDGLPETVKTKGQEYITRALDMDIKHQLNLYEVEYQLLHEEMIDTKQNHERYDKLEAANKELTQEINDLRCELDYAKESADALRKELIDTKEYNQRHTEMLKSHNDVLEKRIAELESEVSSYKRKNAFRNAVDSNEKTVSPASSEVDEIMCRSLEKQDSAERQGSVEKSWELVPSPTTVSREMVNVVSGLNGNFNGQLINDNVPVLAQEKHPVLSDCKTLSNDSCASMDLISFDAVESFGVPSRVSNNILSSSEESLLDEGTNKKDDQRSNSLKKKRPALPVIHTTGLLATCKDLGMSCDQ